MLLSSQIFISKHNYLNGTNFADKIKSVLFSQELWGYMDLLLLILDKIILYLIKMGNIQK